VREGKNRVAGRGGVYFDDVLEGDVNAQGLRRDVRRLVVDEPGLR